MTNLSDRTGRRLSRGKALQRGPLRQGVFDLGEQRSRALARTESAIKEMKQVLDGMASDAPGRYLVESILVGLRSAEARLQGGTVHAEPPCVEGSS